MSYLSTASEMLKALEHSTKEAVEDVSDQFVEVMLNGGVIHLFGCGHSNLIAQDAYYRAGGLAPVHSINIPSLMLYEGAEQASENERKNGFLTKHFEQEDIRENDALVVISTSGRNPAPIDAALFGKERGAYVVGMLSGEYKKNQPSKHDSGYRLEDVVQRALETNVPLGDAVMEHPDMPEQFSPISSVVGIALLQEVFTKTIIKLKQKGYQPPVLKSGNVDGAKETNKALLDRYRDRLNF